MSLIYRGVKYEPTQNSVEMSEGQVIGRYRGVEFKRRIPKHLPMKHQAYGLKYRGAEVR